EGGLLGLAHRVLIEGGVITLHPRIHHGRAGKRADVAEAAGVSRPAVRRTGRHVLVVPAGLVVELVVLPEDAGDRAQPPLIRGAQAELMLLVGIALDRAPGRARGEALGGEVGRVRARTVALVVIRIHAAG